MFVNFVPVVRKRKGWDSLHFGIILIKHKVCMAVILKLDVFTSQLKVDGGESTLPPSFLLVFLLQLLFVQPLVIYL